MKTYYKVGSIMVKLDAEITTVDQIIEMIECGVSTFNVANKPLTFVHYEASMEGKKFLLFSGYGHSCDALLEYKLCLWGTTSFRSGSLTVRYNSMS